MTSATVIRLSDVRPAARPAPPAPPRRLSWAELVEREPALGDLEREMRAFRRTPLGPDFCANAAAGSAAWTTASTCLTGMNASER